jgi:hypothetical protein
LVLDVETASNLGIPAGPLSTPNRSLQVRAEKLELTRFRGQWRSWERRDGFDNSVEDVSMEPRRKSKQRPRKCHASHDEYLCQECRDGIRAAYTDGVLELTVEKRSESKPIKVQVN